MCVGCTIHGVTIDAVTHAVTNTVTTADQRAGGAGAATESKRDFSQISTPVW